MDLSVNIGRLRIKNPVMSASGTFGYGREYADFVEPERLGAVVTKGISLAPRSGNPPPRIVETPAGMINAIGLQNVGLEAFVREKLPWLKDRGVTVIANILGSTVDEYRALAEGLSRASGVHMIEVNASCPNVAAGGLCFGTQPELIGQLVEAVNASTDLPVMVKLTPMVADIAPVAVAAEKAGAEAISLINTVPAMAIDLKTRRPCLANGVGGLSGPAIKPIALRLVWQAAKAVSVPVVGIGGIMTAEDALEFLLAGATAVQVGTANFVNPMAMPDMIAGIEAYLAENRMSGLSGLIGGLKMGDS